MFDFGIPAYRPHWQRGHEEIAAAQGAQLARLTGRPLTHAWLVWDLDDASWFADCPVLLDFAGEQVEINHQKFEEISITWNTVDPAAGVRWPTSDDFRLAWRPEPLPELAGLVGRPLHEPALLEWHGSAGDLANGSLALGFRFAEAELVVFNGLDENAVSVGPPDPRYRRHPLPAARQP